MSVEYGDVVLRADVRDWIVAALVQRLGGEVELTNAELMGLKDNKMVIEVCDNWSYRGRTKWIRLTKEEKP